MVRERREEGESERETDRVTERQKERNQERKRDSTADPERQRMGRRTCLPGAGCLSYFQSLL